jgi:hypothetical protein
MTRPNSRVVAVRSLLGNPDQRHMAPERRSVTDRRLRGSDVFYKGADRRVNDRRATPKVAAMATDWARVRNVPTAPGRQPWTGPRAS